MGGEENAQASIASLVLCCVAGQSIGHVSGKSFTHPGMHGNFIVHGILGFIHFQGGKFGDIGDLYKISFSASKFLALPCLMADLYHEDKAISTIHLLSGVVPFAMALAGNENQQLGQMMIAANVISLCFYSIKKENQWGHFASAAGLFAYFAAPPSGVKVLYPLALALMDFCAFKMFHTQFDVVDPRGRR